MKKTIALMAVMLVGSACRGESLADSVAEYSGQQGQNNWYYGYYAGGTSTFHQMTIYNPSDTLFYQPNFGTPAYGPLWTMPGYYASTSGGGYTGYHWTVVGQSFMHPTGRGYDYLPVRRWVSEVEGTIRIAGNVCMYDLPNRTFDLDGITGRIFIDGVQAFSGPVASTDLVGVSYDFSWAVHKNSTIDFVVDDNSADTCDHAKFTAQIFSIPEPATLALLAGGAVLLTRRRRNRA